MGVQGGVAARRIFRRFHPLRRKGLRCAPINAFRLRLHVPLPPFTPGLAHGLLGKAALLSPFDTESERRIALQDLDRIQLIGHLGQDPEVTYTPTGTARTTFTVATSAHGKD